MLLSIVQSLSQDEFWDPRFLLYLRKDSPAYLRSKGMMGSSSLFQSPACQQLHVPPVQSSKLAC